MGDKRRNLIIRQAVVARPAEVSGELLGAIEDRQRGQRRDAAIAGAKPLIGPYVRVQRAVDEIGQFRCEGTGGLARGVRVLGHMSSLPGQTSAFGETASAKH